MIKEISALIVCLFILGIGPHSNPSAAQNSGRGNATKENLDLPFHFDSEFNDDEEVPPEYFIFYGQQYEGDGIFFSCDRSSSMREGTKWQTLQKELIRNITEFSERVQFGIAFFDATLVQFPTSGRPAEATAPMKAAAVTFCMSLTPGSGTCPKTGLLAALKFANQSAAKRKVIIHLADGMTTCPGHDATVYGQQALTEVTSRNIQRIPINTICIGSPAGEAWMQKLAAMNDGSYVRLP